MLLVESVYAPYRETNSPPTFSPSLQHEAQTCRVLCYRRLQRNVAVALGRRPTAIMVRGIPAVSVTFKRRWVLLLSLMCAVETEDDCFCYTCAVSVLVSKHFFRYRYQTDAGGIGRYRVPDASIGLTLLVTYIASAPKCCIIITASCRLHGTSAMAFHILLPLTFQQLHSLPIQCLSTSAPLAPVQPPYAMPPATSSHSPLVPHRLHATPAAASLNSSLQ